MNTAKLQHHRSLAIVRQGNRCFYCNAKMKPPHDGTEGVTPHPLSATADHVLPRAKGGTNWWRNVVAACLTCNMRKADHDKP